MYPLVFLLKTLPFFIHSQPKCELLDTCTLEESEEVGWEMENGKGWGKMFVPQGVSRKAVGFWSLLILGHLNDDPWFVSMFLIEGVMGKWPWVSSCGKQRNEGVQRQTFCIKDLGKNLISLFPFPFSTTDTWFPGS